MMSAALSYLKTELIYFVMPGLYSSSLPYRFLHILSFVHNMVLNSEMLVYSVFKLWC